MTISYPVSLPTLEESHSSVSWRRINTVALSESPFTGYQEVEEHDGARWAIDVAIDNLDRDQAMKWLGFLDSLRGQRGTFLYGDELTAQPQGAGGGTPLVAGASQTGFTLDTDGWPNSTTVLKAGDRIQIDNSLYVLVADATSNGSGEVTLDIWPHLRGHADNAPIIYQSAKGLFRLASNEIEEPQSRLQLWSIGFTAIEAL